MIIAIQCTDQVGLVAKISGLLAAEGYNIVAMQEHVDKSLLLPRISALLLGIFGVVGLTLAAIAIFLSIMFWR